LLKWDKFDNNTQPHIHINEERNQDNEWIVFNKVNELKTTIFVREHEQNNKISSKMQKTKLIKKIKEEYPYTKINHPNY
jgi:hypothetical protein